MSARRSTERDRRRRELGQNFLVDRSLIRRIVDSLDIRPGELVVDLGASSGALKFELSDSPDRGPVRADLVLQREVARKLGQQPPRTLRAAAWAPWWEFRPGLAVSRHAFRPWPKIDASVLTIVHRDPPILPAWLGPRMREILRPAWSDRHDPH